MTVGETVWITDSDAVPCGNRCVCVWDSDGGAELEMLHSVFPLPCQAGQQGHRPGRIFLTRKDQMVILCTKSGGGSGG
ncbi:hypothetical protein ACOMHN_046284 [Nucella lapillus]